MRIEEAWGYDYTSTVWADGHDVTHDCLVIYFDGEQPIAVELLIRRAGRPVFLDSALVTEIRGGAIAVRGLRRREPA